MINYAVPGVYEHFELNKKLIQLKKSNPNYFFDDIDIEAAYGVFPFSIFDGGRILDNNKHACPAEIEEIVDFYNKNNIKVRLVYTNSQLTEDNYTNKFGNIVLDICNKSNNQVVIADDNFKDYIKKYYSNLFFISSTTKCLNSQEFLLELQKNDYIEVCLDYNLNHNWNLLDNLNNEEKNKCEFLCNPVCRSGCLGRKKHYLLNSISNLNYGKSYDVPFCRNIQKIFSTGENYYLNNISYDDIIENYHPKGFSHFKLEGRTYNDVDQTIIYSEYMIKPEYRSVFISDMLTKKNLI